MTIPSRGGDSAPDARNLVLRPPAPTSSRSEARDGSWKLKRVLKRLDSWLTAAVLLTYKISFFICVFRDTLHISAVTTSL